MGSAWSDAPWMSAEHGAGFELLKALKQHLDPGNLFLPHKLGLSAAPSAKTRGDPGS